MKPKIYSPGLVFPSEDSPSEEVSLVREELGKAGFSKTDQEWLIQVFKRSDCFGDPSETSVFREEFAEDALAYFHQDVLQTVRESADSEPDRQTRLALLFSILLDFGPGTIYPLHPNVNLDKSNPGHKTPDWVAEFQKYAKFSASDLNWQMLNGIRSAKIFHFNDLIPFLFPTGLPLNQVINLNFLNANRRQNRSNSDFEDPEYLEFWLIWRFEDNLNRCKTVRLDSLLTNFRNYPETELGDKISGLLNAIEYTLLIAPGPGSALNDGWQLVARELLPFLELLNEKHPELHQERSNLLKTWWRLSKTIYGWSMGGLESELPQDLRNRLVESASKHIGFLRKLLRESPDEFETEDAPEVPVSSFYEEAFHALLVFAPPWNCLKPLLLAFTEMKKQAVTTDLRPWHDVHREETPPRPYSNIPMWIEISMYPQNLRAELDRDPHLRELREEFAKFCLARLKTRTSGIAHTNEDFVERRPAWRQCHVQALTALRVNPGGRAHRTLFWTCNNDPDETVRQLAKRAHRQIRHLDREKSNLDVGASPRRPLFEAFWWLRQAHLLTLNIEIDQPGAQRTLRKDLHRTREKDDFPRQRSA